MANLLLFYTILSLIILYSNRNCTNFFVQLHLYSFVILVMFFEYISLLLSTHQLDFFSTNIVCIFILFYIFTFIFAANKFKLCDYNYYSNMCLTFNNKYIFIAMAPYLVFKLYLMSIYGMNAFYLLAVQSVLTVDKAHMSLNAILSYPALGAFYVFINNITIDFKKNYNSINLFFCVLFLISYVLFPGGARRFIFFLALYVLMIIFFKGIRTLRIKHIFYVLILSFAMLMSFEWYQKIRDNIFNVTIEDKQLIKAGDYLSMISSSSRAHDTLVDNLNIRSSPFPLMHDIVSNQLDSGIFAEGKVLYQSIINIIPSILYGDKKYLNVDDVLNNIFEFSGGDLTTSLVSIFQSEFFILAFFLTPIFILSLLHFYTRAIKQETNFIFTLSVVGGVFSLIGDIETTVDTVLIVLRDIGLIYILSILFFKTITLLSPKTYNKIL